MTTSRDADLQARIATERSTPPSRADRNDVLMDCEAEASGLRPDIAACRAYAMEAVDMLATIMRDNGSGAANRLRAAIELLERGWGKPDSGTEQPEEPSLEAYLSELGPREPISPEEMEARAEALHLVMRRS